MDVHNCNTKLAGLFATALKCHHLLKSKNFPHVLIGGLAINLHG